MARLTAELADAQYGLDQTVVRAQTEGFVTQVALRRCVPPWFSLITNKADQNLGAAFQQNSLQRVEAGDEAEVAFDAVPGRVFKGSPSPQIRFSQAELIDFGARTEGGRALALIDIKDDMSGYQIRSGGRAGGYLYGALEAYLFAPQDPAADAQLGELRLLGGH